MLLSTTPTEVEMPYLQSRCSLTHDLCFLTSTHIVPPAHTHARTHAHTHTHTPQAAYGAICLSNRRSCCYCSSPQQIGSSECPEQMHLVEDSLCAILLFVGVMTYLQWSCFDVGFASFDWSTSSLCCSSSCQLYQHSPHETEVCGLQFYSYISKLHFSIPSPPPNVSELKKGIVVTDSEGNPLGKSVVSFGFRLTLEWDSQFISSLCR